MYRWDEHTSELELELRAPTPEEVYGAAVAALAELLDAGEPLDGGEEHRQLAVEAPDRARLLAELLSELAFLAESEQFVPQRLEQVHAGPGRLATTVRGRTGEPPHLVKAVTYHRLAFEPDGDGWRATVVLDV